LRIDIAYGEKKVDFVLSEFILEAQKVAIDRRPM